MEYLFNSPPELREYSEDELLGIVGQILAEPGADVSPLGASCLAAINSEFILRSAKEKERFDA